MLSGKTQANNEAAMSSVQHLREFISHRLTAAAEEIFEVFEKTIFEYEESLARQNELLDLVWKPEVKLHRIELPQQPVCRDVGVPTDQERNSSLDQEEPEPLQIKEEQEETCTSQEGEQLVLKQETDAFMLTPYCEDGDHREPEPDVDHQLLSHNSPVDESQDQEGREHEASGSTRNAETNPQKSPNENRSHSNNVYNSPTSTIDSNSHTDEESVICDICGKALKNKSVLYKHLKTHTGEKPYSCQTCGKGFNNMSNLKRHMGIHTGERPFTCKTCGNSFREKNTLRGHMRTHTGEKPYPCSVCGKRFLKLSGVKTHLRIHTGEKPYTCNICGKSFIQTNVLNIHMRTHTGEKPYSCSTCGKRFSQSSERNKHERVHTG